MAADQRRKRLNGVNGVDLSSKEMRVKKKKSGSLGSNLSTSSHIFLEWDGKRKKVIAKKEQIGLSWRDLKPFVNSVPQIKNMLADVVSVPPETFELDNLSDVLSYEAWQTCLSEKERKLLLHFLPKDTDVDLVLQQLLDGDDFHFGNPFLEWGSAVCSGNLHPDAVIRQERRVKADKKAYYSELQRYHYDLIDYLQKLKERWENCKNPEKEIVQKMWGRHRVDMEKSPQNLEHNFDAASESCSWNADEKACSSDDRNSSIVRVRGHPKRTADKAFENEEYEIGLENVQHGGARARKKDKAEKYNIHQTDGAKYMSYLKVSKKQHQLVSNMKRSGKSIQSRSLNRVLGNIKNLDVQPYEVFEEEERKKLHAHWVQIAKDLPAAYLIWREKQSQKREVIASLDRDLKDKLNCWTKDEGGQISEDTCHDKDNFSSYSSDEDVEIENHETLVRNQNDDTEGDDKQDSEDFEDRTQDSDQDNSASEVSFPNGSSEFKVNATEDDADAASLPGSPHNNTYPQASSSIDGHDLNRNGTDDESQSVGISHQNESPLHVLSPGGCNYKLNDVEEDAFPVSGPLQDQSLLQVPSVSKYPSLKINSMDHMANLCISKLDNTPLIMPEKSGNENVRGPWSPVRTGQPYFGSNPSQHGYTSTAGPSVVHPQGNEEQNSLFEVLRSNLHEEDGVKKLLQGQPTESPLTSFPSQDRGDLLHAVFKNPAVSSQHNQEQRQMGLGFQPRADILMDSCQFSGQFPEQKRQNEPFLHENLSENLYCDGSRYLMTRPEHSRPSDLHDWNVGPVRMPAPLLPQLSNNELLSQNWFSGDHQLRNMWTSPNGIQSGATIADQSRNTANQSLFSVLSQCGQLRTNAQFVSTGPMEQYVAPPGSYGMIIGGTTTPRISTGLPQPTHPLEYLGGPQDDMSWVNLSNQNPGLHDPMGKPYVQSWNQ